MVPSRSSFQKLTEHIQNLCHSNLRDVALELLQQHAGLCVTLPRLQGGDIRALVLLILRHLDQLTSAAHHHLRTQTPSQGTGFNLYACQQSYQKK